MDVFIVFVWEECVLLCVFLCMCGVGLEDVEDIVQDCMEWLICYCVYSVDELWLLLYCIVCNCLVDRGCLLQLWLYLFFVEYDGGDEFFSMLFDLLCQVEFGQMLFLLWQVLFKLFECVCEVYLFNWIIGMSYMQIVWYCGIIVKIVEKYIVCVLQGLCQEFGLDLLYNDRDNG